MTHEEEEEGNICSDYLVLKPHHLTLLDLFRIFGSSDHHLAKKKIIQTPEPDHPTGLERRWIIFVSLFAQKLFLYLRTPMAWMGYVIEMWLNLLSSNGGFVMLLLNLLTGSIVKPDKSSAKFASVLGYADVRVELDKRIKTSETRYGASLSMMAAKLAYENQAFAQTVISEHWKMEFLGWFKFWNDYQDEFSTKAIMFKDTTCNPNLIVVAFRGTEPFDMDQWRTDVDFSWYELQNVGRIHAGFMKALGLQKKTGWPKDIIDQGLGRQFAYYTLRQKLREELQKNEKAKFIVTGHSLGGALAILFVAMLVLHEEEELLKGLDWVYTFGQPRVGNEQFGEWMSEKLRLNDIKYLRYVYCNDMMPRLPYDDETFLYKHFGPCLFFNSFYKGEVLWEEPNKNYFSLLWALPKILNAVWELIRGFIIPYTEGPDYKEGWFLRLMRLVGLVIPGLSAHCPQDYVNATRLGNFPSRIHLQIRTPKHD